MASDTFAVQEADNDTENHETVDDENDGELESFNAKIFPIRTFKEFIDFDKNKLANKHYNKGFVSSRHIHCIS